MQLLLNIPNQSDLTLLLPLFKRLQIGYTSVQTSDNDFEALYAISAQALAAAYSDTEPEYDLDDITEFNPNYTKL